METGAGAELSACLRVGRSDENQCHSENSARRNDESECNAMVIGKPDLPRDSISTRVISDEYSQLLSSDTSQKTRQLLQRQHLYCKLQRIHLGGLL